MVESSADAQLSLVDRVVTHPGFNGDTFENDIAVISVEQGADFQGKCYFVHISQWRRIVIRATLKHI